MNRYERQAFQKIKLQRDLGGTGLYVYRNNSDKAELILPKDPVVGSRTIGPRQEFQGDSYFMAMVRRNELQLVREIQAPTVILQTKGDTMIPEKLILDQPDTVTSEGTVEHVAKDKKKPKTPLNDATETTVPFDVLLTEDPIDGVDIF